MATLKKTGESGEQTETTVKKPRKIRSDKGVKKNVAPKRSLESEEVDIDHGEARNLSSEGDAQLDVPQIEVVQDGPDLGKKLETMAFMEEPIEVIVAESADKNAQPIVESWCNGRSQFFVRGQQQTVKRKFVAVLAQAKTVSYTQQEYRDHNGALAIRNIPHKALQYPFTVVYDPSPKGVAWLRETIAAA